MTAASERPSRWDIPLASAFATVVSPCLGLVCGAILAVPFSLTFGARLTGDANRGVFVLLVIASVQCLIPALAALVIRRRRRRGHRLSAIVLATAMSPITLWFVVGVIQGVTEW